MNTIWNWGEQFESTRYWLETLAARARGTKRVYLYSLKGFCEWIDKSPDELIAQRKIDLKAEDPREKYRIENKVRSFMAHLEAEEASYGKKSQTYAAIRSFFENNYLKLDGLRRADAPSGESIGKRIPEKSEIKMAMDVAKTLRDRALMSFAKDCGWRLSDIAALTWGQIREIEEGYWFFQKITKKRKVKAQTFVGPETTKLMALYRKQCERGTMRGERGIPPENITDDSPLFVVYGGKAGKDFRPMRAEQMVKVIGKAFRNAGFNDLSGHSLRKYFQSSLENPKLHIHKTWIKQMLGKKITASDKPYVENRPKKLFEAYKGAYNNLRLEEAISILELQERQTLSEKLNQKNYDGIPWTPEERKRAKQLGLVLRETARRRTETNGGTDCTEYKEIAEGDLLSHLQQGWRIVHANSNGKVIVQR
jgi:integrase